MVRRMYINEDVNNDIESTYDEYVTALDDLRDYIDNMSRHLKKI